MRNFNFVGTIRHFIKHIGECWSKFKAHFLSTSLIQNVQNNWIKLKWITEIYYYLYIFIFLQTIEAIQGDLHNKICKRFWNLLFCTFSKKRVHTNHFLKLDINSSHFYWNNFLVFYINSKIFYPSILKTSHSA